MFYLDFLRELHERLAPRTYLEIGVAGGHSLALSRCRSVGIDPGFVVDQQLLAPVSLHRCTSDDYFASLASEGRGPFADLPIDLAYVDGMHLFEYALRDFIAIERHAASSTVVAFDDVLPRDVEEAARDRQIHPWTGDVFRITEALATHRPDLRLITVDTEPTGTLVVAKLDPSSDVLDSRLDEIVRELVVPDPQPIPASVLARADAMAPEEVLALELWDVLRAQREAPVHP